MPRRKTLATHPIEAAGVSSPRNDRFVEEDYRNHGNCRNCVLVAVFSVLAASSVTVVLSNMTNRALANYNHGEFSQNIDAWNTNDSGSKQNAPVESPTMVKGLTDTMRVYT